jgi:UDP-N-acetylmuramate--alanine ligase
MHVFFSGIGGAGANSFAIIAKQAGYDVSGSDIKPSSYIDYLVAHGITSVQIGQTAEQIAKVHQAKPIDCLVYSSALPLTMPNHPELEFCRQNSIPVLKHDEFLSDFIDKRKLSLIAVAGTHGKSTTTAMAVWLAKELGVKASWSVGAKMPFADTGHFEPDSQLFICEADEFDRKFLSFYPKLSLISGIDWDHPDIYPTRESYYEAFGEFVGQSERTVLWHDDAEKLGLDADQSKTILDDKDPQVEQALKLPGRVNRLDAWLVAQGLKPILDKPIDELVAKLNDFPGVSRRFEMLAPKIYTDYAHTPPKIRGALQLAHEAAGDNVVIVYEGLHNTRQHFIKDELAGLFDGVKRLYIVPSYLAREDMSLELLTPGKLLKLLNTTVRAKAAEAELDEDLKKAIEHHAAAGDLVLCFSAGGAGSLDEWLRQQFAH